MKLIDKINQMEEKIRTLENTMFDLQKRTEARRIPPETKTTQPNLSKVGGIMPSTGTGLGRIFGKNGNVIFNDADASIPAFGTQPDTPTRGYNKHNHSRYAGGALDIHTLELVEFNNVDGDIKDYLGNNVNKHCQSFWKYVVQITKDDNDIEKISNLSDNFVWDKVNQVWRFYAVYADSEA